MDRAKILIVDDEPDILQVIKAYLEKNDYLVYEADTGKGALSLWEHLRPDLIILDLMLPDMSGEEICRTIRKTSNVPILMLTAKSSEDDMVNGILIGADDYITKPFSPRELVVRVISLLRRARLPVAPQQEKPLSFGNNHLSIDSQRHEVKVRGQLVSLTPIEFKLLELLAKHPKRAFSRLELVNLIQGDTFEGFERTIDVHIKNIRQKIGDNPRKPAFIATVFGVGYKFQVNPDE
ncbi:response regulator transcription factor [Paenibacillus melissococcoides]|uniref:Response regulator transcription factor n=1 Tax=Paenibacillus melissococcoides TaxID=2912268 RepID=A0ABM9FYW7_9BACL|nr:MULTISPECIES: response regulator transcription factor [Paenibacillus]MEB9898002.1 response regulator transcription factor [Bacillus cereus]CAH8244429.1 response regulator transcription factor [Paenibacillus melissococcoides]CAH8703228.1 response regulator transcription factor [Paenibacillus melissococcoides]CAH8705549.1 response regulator transcription factor [Paenibacillus melissococcoides]GIO82850.1 DNA-binding response regulator [Paenibacillus dendritiformis]